MKRKKLVLVREENDLKYFTTSYKAAKYLGVQQNTLNWAIVNGNKLTKDGKPVEVDLVDGEGILYNLIDNM